MPYDFPPFKSHGSQAHKCLNLYLNFFVSPFANNSLFVTGTPTVKSVKVSPETATVKPGQSISLSATVATDYFAPQSVERTSNTEGVTVSKAGVVTIGAEVPTSTEVTITATSTFDATKTSTCVITVS